MVAGLVSSYFTSRAAATDYESRSEPVERCLLSAIGGDSR